MAAGALSATTLCTVLVWARWSGPRNSGCGSPSGVESRPLQSGHDCFTYAFQQSEMIVVPGFMCASKIGWSVSRSRRLLAGPPGKSPWFPRQIPPDILTAPPQVSLCGTCAVQTLIRQSPQYSAQSSCGSVLVQSIFHIPDTIEPPYSIWVIAKI